MEHLPCARATIIFLLRYTCTFHIVKLLSAQVGEFWQMCSFLKQSGGSVGRCHPHKVPAGLLWTYPFLPAWSHRQPRFCILSPLIGFSSRTSNRQAHTMFLLLHLVSLPLHVPGGFIYAVLCVCDPFLCMFEQRSIMWINPSYEWFTPSLLYSFSHG